MKINHKSKLCIAMFAACTILSAPQAMAWGLPVPGIGGSSNSGSVDPDSFLKSVAVAEQLMNNSKDLIIRSLVSKEKSAEHEAKLKAAMSLTDPAERAAKIVEVRKTADVLVNEATTDKELKAKIQSLDSEKRAQLGSAAFNFALALLQDKALMEQSSGLISSLASNPMYLSKLGGVKDAASSISNQVSSAANIATKMPDIFTAVGVKAPLNKDEKPKTVVQVATE